ncbi:2888_t:CDS:2, partial [Funneliformis mosseae]
YPYEADAEHNPELIDAELEELIVYSYDIRLKEKCNTYSIKDVVLIDLQENNLYGL